ncbi:MAG: hypothetical protein IKA46_04355 [Clostridia bacterium]|nr:hypothetical protein [Clostridia bacterium]
MQKNTSWRKPLCGAFLIAELTLGILLQVLPGRGAALCSYAAVVLACLFAFLLFSHTKCYYFTQAALLATVCADYFLVLRGAEEKLAAMLFFSVTQLCYFARIYFTDTNEKRRTVHALLRVGVPILTLAITLLVLGKNADAVALISMFYFANLLLNVVFAFLAGEKPPLFAAGLLLFACCDVFVGLSLIEGYLPLAKGGFLYHLAHPGFNLAWIFYVPSQALLALSLVPARKRK